VREVLFEGLATDEILKFSDEEVEAWVLLGNRWPFALGSDGVRRVSVAKKLKRDSNK
jgi:hypothetical protein